MNKLFFSIAICILFYSCETNTNESTTVMKANECLISEEEILLNGVSYTMYNMNIKNHSYIGLDMFRYNAVMVHDPDCSFCKKQSGAIFHQGRYVVSDSTK